MTKSKSEICKEQKEWLLTMDDNSDGKVSLEEFRKRFEHYHSSAEMDELLAQMDVNDNGLIDVSEILSRLDGSPFCD